MIGSIAKEAAEALADQPVEFITFDFTSDETTATAAKLAAELGVEEAYKAHAPKTGYALLIDAETKKVIGRLTKRNDVGAWKAAISDAIGG